MAGWPYHLCLKAAWLARMCGSGKEDDRRGYDGRDPLDLVRAIRNIFEHWFERLAPDEAVLAVTGWDDAETRKGHASAEGQEMRAAAVARYFLGDRFRELLLVFEFAREWPSEA